MTRLPAGLLVFGVVMALLGACSSSPPSLPARTPLAPSEVPSTPIPSPTLTVTPAPNCPADPDQWTPVPYTGPEGKTLYALDPSCAMGLVEEAYGELQEYRSEHSSRWTKADEVRVYWWDGYTSPLTGENYPAADPEMTWEANPHHCWEVTYRDPAGLRYVYYTAAPDDPGRVVLYVIIPPYEGSWYDCETGEVGKEQAVEGYQAFYATLIYDREARAWKLGRAGEEFATLPADANVDGSISLIRQLQGR